MADSGGTGGSGTGGGGAGRGGKWNCSCKRELLTQVVAVVVDKTDCRDGGDGGSGIVIVKELDKASGVWSMQEQLDAQIGFMATTRAL